MTNCLRIVLVILSLQTCMSFFIQRTSRHDFSSLLVRRVQNNDQDVETPKMKIENKNNNIFDSIGNFFRELDAFVDDATNRRLGNGWRYYGKRKSSFYGEDDIGRKSDMDLPDPTEDYQGPQKSGYFQWVQDENGQLRPVTRMKKTNIERNPNYWDRVYSSEEETQSNNKGE